MKIIYMDMDGQAAMQFTATKDNKKSFPSFFIPVPYTLINFNSNIAISFRANFYLIFI